MKFELKDFQVTAVREMMKRLDLARNGIRAGVPQALVLSSPTGSGKTVTLAAFLETIVKGDAMHEANPRATFLWVSDSPELNAQSLDKIWRASDAFPLARLITVDANFDEEEFSPRHLYFINTSKLGREKLLTTHGDKRTWTFWQTVANTAQNKREDFIVIVDEAHRGMAHSPQEQKRAQSIVQKFILGSEEENLPKPGVPILVGMSATPRRFDELLAGTDRSKSSVKITVDDVRESGLLKDMILVQIPSDDTPGDFTLLKQATQRWHDFENQWAAYCKAQKIEAVRPALVVQVEDGVPGRNVLTRTDLDEAVRVIQEVVGDLPNDALAHCFQDETAVQAAGKFIQKIEASRIQDQTSIKVVFFKMSLTTGWDCPRAEVMMSFRKAKDHTLIAQLVGRMIRTPLVRRIEASEVLNTVELYLPHYDEQTLSAILAELQNPDAESGLGTQAVVGREVVIYPRAKGMDAPFQIAQGLPSYSVARVPELPPVKRALRLASRLTIEDELDPNALDEARDACLTVLLDARARLQKDDPNFLERVTERGELEIMTLGVQIGSAITTQRGTTRVALTPENIDDLFERCGRVLGVGEGLHKEFWKKAYDEADPLRAKLELHEVLNDERALAALEQTGNRTFDALFKRNKRKIERLPSSAQEEYNRLTGATKAPAEIMRTLPPEIAVRKDDGIWKHHLYADTRGEFRVKLNTWEKAVLDEELKRPGFVGWLRNVDRKEWSIAIPYDDRGVKPFYPDFVIIRREGGEFVADLIDPHNSKLDDTWAKAKGLAAYADKHGQSFGRLEIVIVENNVLKRMDVNDPAVRKKARRFQSNNDIDPLFV